MKTYTMSAQLVESIAQYLATRPYQEVSQFINKIVAEVSSPQNQPEPKTPAKKTAEK